MHCCVLHIFCIQGTVLDSVSCRPLSYFAISAMNVVGIDTYTPRTVVNFGSQRALLFLQPLVVHMPSCLSVRCTQGLRDSG